MIIKNIDDDFPYEIEIPKNMRHLNEDIDAWCSNTWPELYEISWIIKGHQSWAFRDYEDAIMFGLTWQRYE